MLLGVKLNRIHAEFGQRQKRDRDHSAYACRIDMATVTVTLHAYFAWARDTANLHKGRSAIRPQRLNIEWTNELKTNQYIYILYSIPLVLGACVGGLMDANVPA